MDTPLEKTLVVLKPDSIQRSLIGEIIGRFEKIGLKIVAMKMIIPEKDMVRSHYTVDDNWIENTGRKVKENLGKIKPSIEKLSDIECGEMVLNNLIRYMTAGPVVAMVIEGAHSISLVRKIVGNTEPLSSDVGTIRGDYVIDSYEMADMQGRSVRNLIHASSSLDEAKKEIDIWFKGDLIKYNTSQESILYGIDFDKSD